MTEKKTQARTPAKRAASKSAPPMIRVTTKKDGFRRAGRSWYGVTEIPAGELTEAEIAAIEADPMFTVEQVDGQ